MDLATITTVGALRQSDWKDRTVKEELRQNLISHLQSGTEMFPGIIGFSETVLPAVERAILAGHDLIFLGERGQAKTRLIRRLVELLDPLSPAVDGCEVNDSPYRPICSSCKQRLAEHGDAVEIRWLTPQDRFGEKLATPDTAVADLIGDVDPIKVAEGRYLSDELTIHYGLVPRAHRGIFSVNELPDLPTRIQVSLLNVLEERDIQIRGYTVRLPLDVLLIASANPEDYTNRGRIITPLKDRFGSEIRTHYPQTIDHEIEIMRQESSAPPSEVPVDIPEFMDEVLAEFTHQVRASSHINQRSGVSVRFSVANRETMVASAVRRALVTRESVAVPRMSDLPAIIQSSMGRIEFEVFEEGREFDVLMRILASATLDVFRDRLLGLDVSELLERFEEGLEVVGGDVVSSQGLLDQVGELPSGTTITARLGITSESPAHMASATEFVLEGLHLSRRLNKQRTTGGVSYNL